MINIPCIYKQSEKQLRKLISTLQLSPLFKYLDYFKPLYGSGIKKFFVFFKKSLFSMKAA